MHTNKKCQQHVSYKQKLFSG